MHYIVFWGKREGACVPTPPFHLDPPLVVTRTMSAIHEFHETCHSVTLYFMKKDFKRCCDATTSIHTKYESKGSSAFAFIFGVNNPVQ